MGTHPLETATAEYRHWMSQLATEGGTWQAETVLATLHSRDCVQYLIDQLAEEPDGQVLGPQLWLDLANTDAELGRQTDRLRAQSDLPHWRTKASNRRITIGGGFRPIQNHPRRRWAGCGGASPLPCSPLASPWPRIRPVDLLPVRRGFGAP